MIGSSCMCDSRSRTARWRSSGQQTTSRNPPPPAPVTLAPVAPAASAPSTAWSICGVARPRRPASAWPPSSCSARRRRPQRRRRAGRPPPRRPGHAAGPAAAAGRRVRRLLAEDGVRAAGDAGVEQQQLARHAAAASEAGAGSARRRRDRRGRSAGRRSRRTRPRTGPACRSACRQRSISIVQARSASSSAVTCRPWYANSACSKPDRHRRRRAETRTRGRDVGQRGDLDAAADAGHVHRLADQLVLDVLDPRHDLLLRVVDVDVVVEALLDDHVDVLVDGGVQHPAAVLAVVAGQVGARRRRARPAVGSG